MSESESTLAAADDSGSITRGISPHRFYAEQPKTPKGKRTPVPKTTPIKIKLSGSHNYANEVKEREELNMELAREMKGHFVGPMRTATFLDEFLPFDASSENKTCPDSATAFKALVGVFHEVDMYGVFIKAVARFAPGLKFLDTHSSPDAARDNLAPDVSVYHDDELPNDTSKTDFSKMSTFLEFKFSAADDPFCDPLSPDQRRNRNFPFERDTEKHMQNRGQIGSYSAALLGSQFRIHLFSVSICGATARFIRWDRTGAVVSRSFNYQRNPELLANFFWRYSHHDRRQQGYDPTITIASAEEIEEARSAFCTHGMKSSDFRKVMVPSRGNPKPDLEQPFIIPSPPQYDCRSPFARATRPMTAFDCTSRELVFLKDYWRPNVEGMTKEGDIYAILHAHNVSNIAPFGTGNDVRDHATRTQEFVGATWDCSQLLEGEKVKLPCLWQYRMTLLVIGSPLTQFSSSAEFVGAIKDAMIAHDDAYFKAKVLHRDISVGNILITENEDDSLRGLLIDWEMSVKVDEGEKVARRSKRTGTWQFMSSALLNQSDRHHELEDDRESALWVLLWTALRYTKHATSDVARLTRAFDEAYADGTGNINGGIGKSQYLTAATMLNPDGHPQLVALIENLRKVFSVRYRDPPSPAEFKRLDSALEQGLSVEILGDTLAFKYRDHMTKLKAQNWLVETFDMSLNAGPWPSQDKAESQEVVGKVSTKRKQDADQLNLKQRVMKRQCLTV